MLRHPKEKTEKEAEEEEEQEEKEKKMKKKQKVTEPVHLASVEEPLVSCVQLMELLNRFFPIGTNKPEILYKL